MSPEIKRAKRAKFCKTCGGRIEAGSRYLLIDPWTWIHSWHEVPS